MSLVGYVLFGGILKTQAPLERVQMCIREEFFMLKASDNNPRCNS
jgi:hypothetical protein